MADTPESTALTDAEELDRLLSIKRNLLTKIDAITDAMADSAYDEPGSLPNRQGGAASVDHAGYLRELRSSLADINKQIDDYHRDQPFYREGRAVS